MNQGLNAIFVTYLSPDKNLLYPELLSDMLVFNQLLLIQFHRPDETLSALKNQ